MKCQEWLNWPILYFDMMVVVCMYVKYDMAKNKKNKAKLKC
jgi:hypothetical protein